METHNPLPIFAFGNMRFARIAENWVVHILKCQIHEFKIFCHDKDLQRFLVTRFPEHTEKFIFNADTAFKIEPAKIDDYFQFRKILFRKILLENEEFIFSDLDAIWLTDVRNHFREPGVDFVLQKVVHGKACPLDVRWEIGYTGCMGLWYMRKTSAMLDFLQLFINDHEKHDQRSMNRLIFNHKDKQAHTCKDGYQRVNIQGLTIAFANETILARPYYRRQYNSFSAKGVVHPVVKEGTSTIKTLQSFNLWHPRTYRSSLSQCFELLYKFQRKMRRLD